jgi:predicted Zn finger-like uncharacterized protein
MIVKCEQCQTRFKIPDDKVTEKGVKVRCTKCGHTFRVKKEGETTAPAPAGAVDPFAKFGPAPAQEPSEETRPHNYAMGDLSAMGSGPAEVSFDAPTRVAPVPPPPPGRQPLTEPAPFDFSSFAPPAVAPPKSDPRPFDFGALEPAPGASDVTQRAAVPGPPKGSAFEPQPFDFSGLAPAPEAPKPSEQTVRQRAPQAPKPSAFEPQPFDFSSLGGVEPPPEPTQRAAVKAPPPPSNFEPQPFDFSSLELKAPPPPPAAPPPVPPKQAPKSSAPKAPPPSAPKAPQPAPSFDLDPMDFGPPPAAPPAPPRPPRASPAAVTQLETPVVSEPESGGLLGDIPPDTGSLSIDVDDGLEAEPAQRGSLFDMPAVPEPTENQLSPAPQEQVAVAKIALKKVSAAELNKPQTDDGQTSSARRSKRGVVSMVWNVLSGLVLLALLGVLITVVLNEGKVDAALSWSKLKGLFTTPRELVAFDISNGLYDTRAGRPVFYVRGEVKNRGKGGGRVKVKAEILDGEDLVRSAEGWVGATPSPEDLYGIATADDLGKLATRLATNATKLQPGAEGPFLVTFYEYPPDLKDFRVRVTVSAADDGTTAAR